MKHPPFAYKTLLRVYILLSAMLVVLSCENKIDLIPKSDLLTLPSLTVKDFETVYTDSGRLKLIMYAPLMEEYTNSDAPYYEFKSGIRVIFYDGRKDPAGSVTAKYAKYTKSEFLWELRDSVVVINEGNDKLETEILFWDEKKDLIYSDRFVKITNEDQIVMGTGFESDPRLNKRKIKKVSATIFLKDEE
ncbi:MAG: LPS export ABC transporter periplasmic protein LptC [Bacteroidales bacterium]|nr:LPS export ABC transporter periplasmic protein LptC [Bacteroidales bacterium]